MQTTEKTVSRSQRGTENGMMMTVTKSLTIFAKFTISSTVTPSSIWINHGQPQAAVKKDG